MKFREGHKTKRQKTITTERGCPMIGTTKKNCVWCKNPNADENDLTDPNTELCIGHLAEYEGTSINGLYAQDAAEAEEMFWAYH
jgi:hypothetical protein